MVIILWLVTLHSIFVGIGMILFPTNWILYFNIIPSEHRFFITQGGVFHLIMAIAYGMAAYNAKKNLALIKFAIIAKFIATLFLLFYFILINQFGIVLLSAISDFSMGLVILLIYRRNKIVLDK